MAAVILSAIALVVACLPPDAAAHGATAGSPQPQTAVWTTTLALLLATSAALYAVGVRRLWRRAGVGRGVRGVEVVRFGVGWIVLAGALLLPIDAYADRSFALHMLQHELLMLVAAPLFVSARPLEVWTWALAPGVRRAAAAVAHARSLSRAWRIATSQPGAWCAHALALWLWHVPALFLAAVAHPALHALQHGCFLGSALLFWWSVFRPRAGLQGGAIVSVFTTMLHTGALGALLALAAHPFYVVVGQATILGLSALEDQQLGGLIMWAPGSIAYLVAGLIVVRGWLSPTRVRHDVA